MAEKQTSFNLFPKIINGGIAGMVGLAVTFPTDLIKVRFQKQQPLPDGSLMYTSIVDAFGKVYRNEGLRGLYRGASVVVMLITPISAVRFCANDFFRFSFRDRSTNTLSIPRQTLAGALTGMVQLVVSVPMELLKIQLQDAGRVAAVESHVGGKQVVAKLTPLQLVKDLYKSKGMLGFYKGTIPTMCRDMPFCTLYFPLFGILDGYGPKKSGDSGGTKFYWSFLSAMIAASIAAFAATPADVMKTRIQSVTKGATGDKVYGNVFDAFKDMLKTEGVTAFFKGGACRILVIAPQYAIVQTIFLLGIAERMLGLKKN